MASSELEYHLLSRLKLRQLRLLVAVDQHRNILKASEQLNMAQPAATKNIRDLEKLLQVSLFDRSSRGVTPTRYGDIVIKHAKLILSQIKQTSEEITTLSQGITGHINVGTLLAASPTLIPQSVLELKKKRPNITVSIIEGTNDKLMPGLRAGDIDLVIGRLPEFREREGLTQKALYDEPIVIVACKEHPLTKIKKITFKRLAEYDWILPPPQTSLRRQLEAEFRNAGHEPPTTSVQSISILTNFKLISETDMIAAMPLHVVSSNPLLTPLSVELLSANSAIGVTYRTGAVLSPAVEYYIETLVNVAKQF